MKSPVLSRRRMLRGVLGGATVALGLPALEAMIAPRAEAAPLPPIFGIFYWANGMPWHDGHGGEVVNTGYPDLWTPGQTGAGYTPSQLLEPLAAFTPSVITGLTPQTEVPPDPPGQSDGHMRGFMVALTGDRIRPDGFDHPSHTLTALRPSLDQYVAKNEEFIAQGATPYQSLVLGVSTARFHDYGHWNAISYNGPDSLNLPVQDPGQLYDLLFSVPTDTALLGRRAQLLDAVMDDAKSLRLRLGSGDRARLDEHLDHIHAVQNRLEFSGVACEPPGKPAGNEDLIAKTELMGDLLARALACGMTRVFSFMLTSPATNHVFSNLGVGNVMHAVCHDGEWENVRKITIYQMQAFAAFLGKLQAVTDVNGAPLLDRSLVFGVSEYGEGWKHSVTEMPALLAGGANGKINLGVHAREPGGNYSKVHVTILRALGLTCPSYGFNGGETTEHVSGVLA